MPVADDIGAAGERPYECVELRLSTKATELWSAIEVAQYAHLILHDEPRTQSEVEALKAFSEAFREWIERWDETGLPNKAPLLQAIDAHLKMLTEVGLFIHWGCVERRLELAEGEGCTVPIAIVTIDRNDAPAVKIRIPEDMHVSSEGLDRDD